MIDFNVQCCPSRFLKLIGHAYSLSLPAPASYKGWFGSCRPEKSTKLVCNRDKKWLELKEASKYGPFVQYNKKKDTQRKGI